MLLRPVRDTEDDAEAVRQLADAAFADPHIAGSENAPAVRTPDLSAQRRDKIRHLARTDPAGSWLAADTAGEPVGAAQSLIREGTWVLALLVVLPEAQGKGVGAALLERAMQYGKAACAPSSAAPHTRWPHAPTAERASTCIRRCG